MTPTEPMGGEENLVSEQVACLDKQVYDLNRACLTGEHFIAFYNPTTFAFTEANEVVWIPVPKGLLSCACGRIYRRRPVGFIVPKEQVVYKVPTNINNVPLNFGVTFAERAVARFGATSHLTADQRELLEPWLSGANKQYHSSAKG